jgi:predicted ArsR family transcriptional regulator
MKPTGVNMTNVKQINRANVLRLLLSRGAMSRTDLANELNLTTGHFDFHQQRLIQRGLIIQSGKTELQNSGRKKCPLRINPLINM